MERKAVNHGNLAELSCEIININQRYLFARYIYEDSKKLEDATLFHISLNDTFSAWVRQYKQLITKSEYKNKPTNAPRYRRPAKTIGETSFRSSLVNGELSPNNEADIKMYRIGFLSKYHLLLRSSVNIVLCGSKFFQLTPIVNYDSSNVVR
jgi:hypothetical protein